jgi:hypothetical protein
MGYSTFQGSIQPGFLRGPYGLAWGGGLGVVKDFLGDLTKQGIQQRFIIQAQQDALAAIGSERGIPQGISESSATYITSLLSAWQAWELGGTPWAILALLNFLGYETAYIICQNGTVYGPSAGVMLPNSNAGQVGVPPTITPGDGTLTVAIGGAALNNQGIVSNITYWEPSTSYGSRAIVTSNPTNGFAYEKPVGTATSGATQPNWPIISGQTVSDGGITWTCLGVATAPQVGQGNGTTRTDFWSAYLIVFDAVPASWNDIFNPPLSNSSPSIYELAAIWSLISSFNAASATCLGILAVSSTGLTRATFGWPTGRTFYGDAGMTAPSVGATSYWLPHTVYAVDRNVIPTAPNGYWYRITTTFHQGTSGYTQPMWPTSIGGTVSDGSITWTCMGQTGTYLTNTSPLATVFQFEQSQEP